METYRIAVLSDIHGNLPAFEAVLRSLQQHAPLDAILVAGDIVGGPGQQVILQKLIDLNAVMIQGNGEQRIAQIAASSAAMAGTQDTFGTARQSALTRWVYSHLSPVLRDFLCALPEQRTFTMGGSHVVRMVHGSPRSVGELVLPNRECHPNLYYKPVMLEEVIGLVSEPVLLFGHTHLPWQARIDGKLALNPGAVSFPENGFIGAQYAILEWDGQQWLPAFYQLSYDLEKLKADYQQSGFLACSPLARIILNSILSGKDYLPVYFDHVCQIARTCGWENQANDLFYPDDIWDEAQQTFPWYRIESNGLLDPRA